MKKICLFVLLFYVIIKSDAQNFNFKHLSVKDGLVSNMVHTTLQDSDGFMWFGTEDGLSRYDGYSFLNFFQSPTDSLSLNNNLIITLAEDKNKQLWIGTHQGLNRLDLDTYKITRFNQFFKEKLGFFSIVTLYVDDNLLWIGTDNSGLFSLDINTYQVQHYQHDINNNTSINSNTVNSIVKDPKRGLLIATDLGLDVFNSKTQTFEHVLTDMFINSLELQNNGNVLLGIHGDEACYIKLKGDFEFEKKSLPINFSKKEVKIFSDIQQNIWISVRDHGLLYVDHKTKNIHRLLYDKNNASGINSNTITQVFEDDLGNIWLSSFDGGVNVLDKNQKNFIHIRDNHLSNGLLNNRVRSMYQDSEGDIWIGTKVNGTLSKFDRKHLTFQHYFSEPKKTNGLSNDYVFSITEDKPGFLWVGTLDGLNLFNKKTGEFKVWKHQEDDVNSLSGNSISSLLKLKDSLLIGTVTAGLDIYNTKTKKFTHYKKTGAPYQISDDRIKTIYKDSYQNIWIGTLNGLNLFDLKTGEFQQFLNNPVDKNSISENYILSIYEDKNHNLWIGTTLGINLMDREQQSFKVYTTKDGLAGNSVRGILEDDNGNLWISTNNGLSKFNTKTEEFKNYNVHDGLQANEFSPFVNCKTANGEMYFGGNNGFNIFNPVNIIDNTAIPKVLLTAFKLFNQPVSVGDENSLLQKHITKTKKLTLNHQQSVFGFEFVALNFTTPEKNEYAYKMEGFDKDWNYIGNKREATYTNLDAGTYTFKVKASNNDGFWNEKGTSVKITILPPSWKTWWAYTIYFFLLLLLLWWFRQNALKRNNFKKQRELNALKINFFGNISHEFRTPLTLILGPLEKMLQTHQGTAQENQLRLMSKHTKRLLNLVNQLLDFQKIGSGNIQVHRSTGDLVQYIKELSNLFVELSNDKEIQFEFQSNVAVCQTNFDQDKIEKIVFNLLSNAFKFTAENGKVIIALDFNKKEQIFTITVTDTGIGIPEDQQKNIFNRFYQVQHSSHKNNPGSGIGLALTKEYVELLGGNISVNSKVNLGTSFKVAFPLSEWDELAAQETKVEAIQVSKQEMEEEDHQQNKKAPLVLLVEDNSDLRGFIKNNLEKSYRIIEAADGEAGLKQAIEHTPDMIISDVMMPKMDGNEMCALIKKDSRVSHIPVILLTAQISEEQQVVGFNHGADQYITKPFSFDVLESRIQSLLWQRKNLQSLFGKKLEVNPSEITVTSVDEQLIKKALDLVEENIENTKYSVQELSESLDISRGHLYRKINSITGKTPSEFIKSIRLKRAAQLLQSGHLNVSEVAYKVGFTNPKYFSKSFKAEFKVSPSKYSEHHKK